MGEIVKENLPVSREVMSRSDAVALFERNGREIQGRDHPGYSRRRRTVVLQAG
jgi:threonyl-tRNA synthetase